jgi:urease accessory protein
MKPTTPLRLITTCAAVLIFPALACAHTNLAGAQSWSSGLAHPWLGWDHLIAAMAVGLWAAQLEGAMRWAAPAGFVGAVACGAALGMGGFLTTGTEPMIVISVITLGLLVARAMHLGVASAISLVACFGLFHGFAHGAETAPSGNPAGYLAGLVAATAALHVAGFVAGRSAQKLSSALPRALGAACAGAGVLLLFY